MKQKVVESGDGALLHHVTAANPSVVPVDVGVTQRNTCWNAAMLLSREPDDGTKYKNLPLGDVRVHA
jgi:hypothetical protein